MALVPRCDTNQGRWRAPLSCKLRSLLVLFKCLPLALSPLPHSRPALHPRLQPPSPGLSPPSQVQVNPLAGRRGILREPRPPPRQAPLSRGSACVSVRGAVSRPSQDHFIFKCYNQASDPLGALYGCGPRSPGQDGDLIAPAEERSGGAK